MEKKINLVELLKDCPKGMELDCVMFDNVSFAGLQNSSSPIVIHTPDGYKYLNAFGCYHDSYRAKCVIFPKGKKTWEGFQRPFVDGDVIADDHGNIAIYKGTMWYNKKLANYYCGYRKSDNHFIPEPKRDGYFGVIEELHYASKEEKRKLFDVIEKNDYEWDVENKTLVKKQKFKDGDIVACDDFRDFCKSQIFIFKNKKENIALSSCYLMLDGDKLDLEGGMYYVTRFATGEEKNKLFKALKDNGYRWDEKNKTLEKLPIFKVGNKIMAFSVKAIKGTNDVLPNESHKYQYVEQAALDTAKSFGFLEMRTPACGTIS